MDGSGLVSLRVLVIPEDPLQNGHILRPLTRAILAAVDRPKAKVTVLNKPRVRGYDDAVKTLRGDLIAKYGFMDLWLFFPDADKASPDAMSALEDDLRGRGVTLLCCPAVPEVEIYACAAYRPAEPGEWKAWRSHPQLKETIFAGLLRDHGDLKGHGGGRRSMVEKALRQRQGFFALCPEVARLRDRIAEHLAE